jgi:hypothetical protein
MCQPEKLLDVYADQKKRETNDSPRKYFSCWKEREKEDELIC